MISIRADLPSNLLGQFSGPAACFLGGVLTGHVAGGQYASTQLLRGLRGIAALIHNGPDVSQHFLIWIPQEIKQKGSVMYKLSARLIPAHH